MQLSRLTFSLASLIVLLTFFALPVMAHDDGVAQSATSHNPNNGPGNNHVWLKSFTITGDPYITSDSGTLTGTVTFAAPVAAVDPDGIANNADDLHATLLVHDLEASDFIIEKWVPSGSTGTYNDAPDVGGQLRIASFIPGGNYGSSTTTDTTFTVTIALNLSQTPTDGQFRIRVGNVNNSNDVLNTDTHTNVDIYPGNNALESVPNDPGAADVQPVVYYDTTGPTVTPVLDTGSRDGDGNIMGPFIVSIGVQDDVSGFEYTATSLTVANGSANGSSTVVDVSSVQLGGGKYIVNVTPKPVYTAETAAQDISLTFTATDKAGNTSTGTFTDKLAARTATAAAPVFATGASIADISAVKNAAITSVTLPEATDLNGDTITYSLTPTTLPAGLAFDATTRVLSGTPTASMIQTAYTYTATDDSTGTLSSTLTFNITVAAAADTDPKFERKDIPAGTAAIAVTINDVIPLPGKKLPLADDNEGDELSYEFLDALPAGLQVRNNDDGDRFIYGTPTAATADGGTDYTWQATDLSGDTAQTEVKLIVRQYHLPEKPTGLTARKLDSADPLGPTQNVVELTWDQPTDKSSYKNGSIPLPEDYVVYQTKMDELTGQYPDDPQVTYTSVPKDRTTTPPVASDDESKFTRNADDVATHFTAKLAAGTYKFKIVANNISPRTTNGDAGNSVKSEYAEWTVKSSKNADVTLDYVVVSDPPHPPRDLDGAVDQDGDQVTLDWLAPDVIHEDIRHPNNRGSAIGAVHGGSHMFGGYVVYQTRDEDDQEIRYPAEGYLTKTDTKNYLTDRSFQTPSLASGEYVYRVAAANIAGESAESISKKRFTIVSSPSTTAPPVGDVSASYSAATGITTIDSGMISPNGFAVVPASALPDLEYLFSVGGTITLTDPGSAAAKSVVMSEILWGLDYGEPAARQKNKQFIELYNTNTSGAATDLAGWTLVFKEGRPAPANDVDQISNVSGAGWIVNVGKSGRVTGTTLFGGTIPPEEIISMYRNINYVKVQNAGDAKRLDGVPGGNGAGGWKASTRVTTQTNIKSSPGRKHFEPVKILTATSVPRSPFVINEIGNDTGGANDWVELRNVTDSEASLKGYHLSVLTGDHGVEKNASHKDTQLFHFHDKDIKVPAKGVILIASTDPINTDIAAGVNKEKSANDQDPTGLGGDVIYVVRSFNIPDSGRALLILRQSGKSHEKEHIGTAGGIKDVVGTLHVKLQSTATNLWPLEVTGAPHGNVIDGGDEEFKAGFVYKRNNAGGGTGEKHLGVVGYTGIGYDRVAAKSAVNGGTPGYDNGAAKEKIADLSNATVTISEIMLDVGEGRQNLPQWIELYNSSLIHAARLNGWKLNIENADDIENTGNTVIAVDATLTLSDITIQPNQTVLIVTTSGRTSDADHFPATRVHNIWTTKSNRDALGMQRRTDQAFSTTGLYIELVDKDNKMVDEFGNLDGSRRTRDEPTWAFPMSEDGRRSSLLRVYDGDVKTNGTMEDGWRLAADSGMGYSPEKTYYGDPGDYGSPGFRAGGPLPVSLSKFRPERLDSGDIVIRWSTESELNNAGFNILRSEKRNGQFTQINTSLIAGQGTTSEKTNYEWKDATAKPNVVYYYQIQDVSLDGKVQTLRQSRLKGYLSPAGKLATTWGDLKSQD